MAYEQRAGDIAIFRETDKKNEKAPDWKGTMVVPEGAKPGDKMEVAVWMKGDKGTMLAGQVKFPQQRSAGPAGDQGAGRGFSGRGGSDPFNTDFPF